MKFKKVLKCFISATMVLSVCGSVLVFSQAYQDYKVKLNGNYMEFNVPPVMIEDRILVPMRAIFEALGATVEWDDLTQTATGRTENTFVSVTINEKAILKNGVKTELDVPAQLVNERTMVPVRAVSEAFLCDVEWNEAEGTVIINEKKVSDSEAVVDDNINDTDVIIENSSDVSEYEIFEENGRYKINKKDGTPLISGSFSEITELNGVIITTSDSGKKVAYKSDGEKIILGEKIENFGNCLLRCTYSNDTKFINAAGEIFEDVKKYDVHTVAKLVAGEKYYFKDVEIMGRVLSSFAFNAAHNAYELVDKINFYVILDENANIISEPYTDIFYQNGVFKAITQVNTVGILSENGDVIVPFKYNMITVLDEILLAVNDKKDIYIYNKDSKLLYDEPFSMVGNFSDGRALVKKEIDRNNSRYGYIDESRKLISGLPYSDAKEFKDGIARVKFEGKYINIDVNGNVIE